MAKKRQQRSSIDGQEEMCDALWELAQEVERRVRAGEATWLPRGDGCVGGGPETTGPIGKAMERISEGYGYRLLEIQ